MTEKRSHKRLPVTLHLSISDLFAQDNMHITNLDSPITVIDISEKGIGFISQCILPENYYFNANLSFGSDLSSIFTIVKIVRSNAIDNETFQYGAGTESINNRLKQLVKTVVAVHPDKNIYLYIEGKQVDVMGGDGVIITQPLNVSDFGF